MSEKQTEAVGLREALEGLVKHWRDTADVYEHPYMGALARTHADILEGALTAHPATAGLAGVTRIVCHFSCGASSAVATKLAIEENKRGENFPLAVVRCIVREEHEDNDRFAADCEKWFGVPIQSLINGKYDGSIYRVFEKERYIAGIAGARCSRNLKRDVAAVYALPGDIDVMGFTAESEEQDRLGRLLDANAERRVWPILIEKHLRKEDCLAMVERAGIRLPEMYALGYGHNNCKVCVKGGAGYLNKTRIDFPKEFERMARVSRDLGVKLVKIKGVRMFLDELPVGAGNFPSEPVIQCGIFCEMEESRLSALTPRRGGEHG